MKRIIAAMALTAVLIGNAVPAMAETPAEAPPAAEATATAETQTTVPEVSIAPDSPFYSLKLWVEKLRFIITRDAAERAELLTKQAETRLLEATQMMEAGKSDLAAVALAESQQKFHQAQSVVATAVEAGKQLDGLQSQLTANEALLKVALGQIMVEAPAEEKEQFEAAATDLLVEFAVAKDEAESKETPRIDLVLEAMANESGKSLEEVLALYQQAKAISTVAGQLKIELKVVQEAAKIEIKIDGDKAKIEIKEANGTKTEIKIEEGKTEVKVEQKAEQPKVSEPKIEVKIESKKEKDDDKGCKEHPVFKVHPGKGKGKGVKDKKCKDRDDDDDDEDDDD